MHLRRFFVFKKPFGSYVRTSEAIFSRILEIGCGEGSHTKHLAPLAEQIIGLGPSPKAIKRARASNIANAFFDVGDLLTYRVPTTRSFDVVTACESYTICESSQLVRTRNLMCLGKQIVVTYYEGAFDRLDAFFAAKDVKSETIKGSSCKWRIVHWGQI